MAVAGTTRSLKSAACGVDAIDVATASISASSKGFFFFFASIQPRLPSPLVHSRLPSREHAFPACGSAKTHGPETSNPQAGPTVKRTVCGTYRELATGTGHFHLEDGVSWAARQSAVRMHSLLLCSSPRTMILGLPDLFSPPTNRLRVFREAGQAVNGPAASSMHCWNE